MVGRLRAAGNRVYLAIAVVALLILVATEPPSVSRINSFANGTAVAKWMVGYHRQPEPQRAADAMAMLSAEGGLKSEHRLMTIAAFLAGVIDRDSSAVGPLVAQAANAGCRSAAARWPRPRCWRTGATRCCRSLPGSYRRRGGGRQAGRRSRDRRQLASPNCRCERAQSLLGLLRRDRQGRSSCCGSLQAYAERCRTPVYRR